MERSQRPLRRGSWEEAAVLQGQRKFAARFAELAKSAQL
jgi:hypothetical protein